MLLHGLGLANYTVLQVALLLLLASTTPVFSALPTYLVPLVAAILATAFLAQPIGLPIILAGAAIDLGAALLNAGRQKVLA